MDVFKNLLPLIKYFIFGIVVIVFIVALLNKSKQLTKAEQALELYKRQISGQLTEKEQQLESANEELGISRSKLMSQQDLLKAYQEDNQKKNTELEAFKKKYQLEIDSYQRSIASLQQQIKNKGNTTLVDNGNRTPTDTQPDKQFNHLIDPSKDKLSYKWDSGDGRFSLYDPDIFTTNTEKVFTYNQSFRITGEVFREKVGFLKTQQLTLEEVVNDGKNKDGSLKYKVVGKAKIIDSKFNYSERSPDAWIPHKSVFGVWPTISANFGLNNGVNPRFLLGTGIDFLNVKGFGLGAQAYLDINVIQDSAFGVELSYRPTIASHQLNLGLTLGLATQFRAPFQSVVGVAGVNFYLW